MHIDQGHPVQGSGIRVMMGFDTKSHKEIVKQLGMVCLGL